MAEFKFEANTHRYFLDGKPLTGVTTILGVIAKPALVPWAAKMTTEYIRDNCKGDVEGVYVVSEEQLDEAKAAHRKRKEAAADFGTVVHDKVEGYVKACIESNQGVPLDEYDFDLASITDLEPKLIEKAGLSLGEFVGWAKENVSVFVESEAKLYSEEHWYAGTVDIIYKDKEGKLWIADIKTSSGVYPEMFAQMGGYDIAWQERNGAADVHGYVILHVDKKKCQINPVGFHDTQMCREFFLHALGLYRISNNIKI